MKYYINYLATIVLMTTHIQADIPPDVQRVVDVRKAEIRKLDHNYIEALERLKDSYTKRGELKTALMISEMIEEVEVHTSVSAIAPKIVGRWVLVYKEKSLDFAFLDDGTFTGFGAFSGKPFSGRWEKTNGNDRYAIHVTGDSDSKTPAATVRLLNDHLEWESSNPQLLLRGTRKE